MPRTSPGSVQPARMLSLAEWSAAAGSATPVVAVGFAAPAAAAGPERTCGTKRSVIVDGCQSPSRSGTLRRMLLDRLPISILRTRFVPSRWDVLAFLLVLA